MLLETLENSLRLFTHGPKPYEPSLSFDLWKSHLKLSPRYASQKCLRHLCAASSELIRWSIWNWYCNMRSPLEEIGRLRVNISGLSFCVLLGTSNMVDKEASSFFQQVKLQIVLHSSPMPNLSIQQPKSSDLLFVSSVGEYPPLTDYYCSHRDTRGSGVFGIILHSIESLASTKCGDDIHGDTNVVLADLSISNTIVWYRKAWVSSYYKVTEECQTTSIHNMRKGSTKACPNGL